MKYIFITAITLTVLLMPIATHADILPYADAWTFFYRFTFQWNDSTPLAQGYSITTADTNPPATGSWRLQLFDRQGSMLAAFSVQPGDRVVTVPYTGSGYRAVLLDDHGAVRLTEDVSGSSVCNENNVCDSQYGENATNCPSDCGAANQQAAVGNQFIASVGMLLWAGGLAVAGMLVLLAVRSSMDKGRRL